MTRSQRRTRSRRRNERAKRRLGLARNPHAAGIYLAENPNGARPAARLVGPHDPTHVDGRYHDPREAQYAPLTVQTPALNERGNPDKRFTPSQYTV